VEIDQDFFAFLQRCRITDQLAGEGINAGVVHDGSDSGWAGGFQAPSWSVGGMADKTAFSIADWW
jgi:hypothetical protein